MKKVIRLTERDLTRLVKRIINEWDFDLPRRKEGIIHQYGKWHDSDENLMDDENDFEYDDEFEFGPGDYEQFVKHSEGIPNKWGVYHGKRYYDLETKRNPIKLRTRSYKK